MKALFHIPILITLAAATMLAESETVSYEYVGDVVNARCLPAAEIVSRNSRGFSPSGGINSFAGARYKVINTQRMRGKILDTCRLHPGVTEFALVLDNGNFFKLDNPGNVEVMRLRLPLIESVPRVNVTGSVDRETLKVQSLSPTPEKQ
jgi:hypothetical protein